MVSGFLHGAWEKGRKGGWGGVGQDNSICCKYPSLSATETAIWQLVDLNLNTLCCFKL